MYGNQGQDRQSQDGQGRPPPPPRPGIPPNMWMPPEDPDKKKGGFDWGKLNWPLIIIAILFLFVAVPLAWDFVRMVAGGLAGFTDEVSRTFERTGFRNERELTNFFTITLFLAFLGLIYWLLRKDEGDDDED